METRIIEGVYGISVRGGDGVEGAGGNHYRSPGKHLSGILKALAIRTNVPNIKDDDLGAKITATPRHRVGVTPYLMKLVIGFAWERLIATQIEGLDYQPGELTLDGIIATPDGYTSSTTVPGAVDIHEIKATYYSSARPIIDMVMWIWQAAGLLKMLSALLGVPCTRAIFHVLYIKGDYRESWPLYITHEVTFTPRELDEYWAIFVAHKQYALDEKGGIS